MLDNKAKGGANYNKRLLSARENGEVGVHKHLITPQPATCRLGMVGKKPSKKTLKELGLEDRTTQSPKKNKKAQVTTVEEARALLAKLEAQAKRTQAPTKPIEQTLEQKWKAQQVAKMQKAMDVPQYGRNVVLNTKNNPG